tara:strand:- start:9020 stop:9832 length:813 start_codon:yes stop_codon:yes gene_type:complete
MPRTRDAVFSRVSVDHLVGGGSRVSWELQKTFTDPTPHTFQLQFGKTGLGTASDWADVGSSVEDVFYATDSTQRVYGKRLTTHYRVKLTTSAGTYYSEPVATYGLLSKRDWLIAKSIVRKELLRHEKKASPNGYFLKRKWSEGTSITDHQIVDPLTGEVVKTISTPGKGTSKVGGYYDPVAMYMDLSPETHHLRKDMQGKGTINDVRVQGRTIAFPQLNTKDVWVDATSDKRYFVHAVQHSAEIRGVPIIVNVELRPAPFNDPIYEVSIT